MESNSLSDRDFRLRSERPGALLRLASFTLRRRREMLLVGGGLLALTVTSHAFPRRYRAEAWVAPPGAEPYEAPIERLLETALAPEALQVAASLAGVTTAASVLELFQSDRGLEGRLGLEREVRRDARGALQGVVLRAEAPRRDQAELLVGALARGVVEHNRALLGGAADSGPIGSGVAPTRVLEVRERLADLRQRHPGLQDVGLLARARELERALADDRVELAGWEARATASAASAARLGEAVREEALAAWREEVAAAAAPARPEPRVQPEPPADRVEAATTRLEQLEAELRLLRATRTERHPEVRRLLRLIEGERQAETRRALDAPVAPSGRPVLEPVRCPVEGRVRLVTGDEAQPPSGDPPAAFLQRAPSYGSWMAARLEEAGARREVDARRRTHDARQAEQLRVQAEVASLEDARRTEAGLAQELQTLEHAAAAAVQVPAVVGAAPLDLRAVRTVPLTWTPWGPGLGLLLAAGVALLAGLAVDVLDRAYYRSEELQGLPVPLLGVVPHLRRR